MAKTDLLIGLTNDTPPFDPEMHRNGMPATNGAATSKRMLKVTQLSSVTPEHVAFWWRPYIPKGRPVSLGGDPGVGKSSLLMKIVAHMTTGLPFPNVFEYTPSGDPFEPQNVCLLSSEDDAGDTIRPRVDINGGDPSKVYLINGWEAPEGKSGLINMQDLELLREALNMYRPAIIIFDPIQAYLGQGINMNRAEETRPILAAVADLCKPYDCTPLYVRHTGKSSRDKSIHADIGSIDIVGNMRSALILGADPDNENRRILAHSKSNSAPLGKSMAYRIESCTEIITSPDGREITFEAPKLMWDGLSNLTANDLTASSTLDDEEKPALEQAKDFLQELLKDGPVPVEEVRKTAAKTGHAWATVRRAKAALRVRSYKPGENWVWCLPDAQQGSKEGKKDKCFTEKSEAAQDAQEAKIYDSHIDEHLEHLPESIEKLDGYSSKPRCSYEHLEIHSEGYKNQQLVQDAQDAHPYESQRQMSGEHPEPEECSTEKEPDFDHLGDEDSEPSLDDLRCPKCDSFIVKDSLGLVCMSCNHRPAMSPQTRGFREGGSGESNNENGVPGDDLGYVVEAF